MLNLFSILFKEYQIFTFHIKKLFICFISIDFFFYQNPIVNLIWDDCKKIEVFKFSLSVFLLLLRTLEMEIHGCNQMINEIKLILSILWNCHYMRTFHTHTILIYICMEFIEILKKAYANWARVLNILNK